MDCTQEQKKSEGHGTMENIRIVIPSTRGKCPAGERRGDENIAKKAIPVLSCEGACIRGEIARTAANIISRLDGYARGCHGELVTVPDSAIARWIRGSERVVVIDGCFLKCHRRLFAGVLDEDKITSFDALSYYGRYTEHFDADAVPPAERNEVAEIVAARIREELDGSRRTATPLCGCGK